MDRPHQKQDISLRELSQPLLSKCRFPIGAPVNVPVQGAGLPVGQLVLVGFGDAVRRALVLVVKVERQFFNSLSERCSAS